MFKLGLTGNIGCGKSSVSKELEKRGAHIIDADLISREIYNYEDVMNDMREFFPEAVIGNEIDRKKLGEIVFSDSERLEKLNEITHGKIRSIVVERMKKYEDTDDLVVVDAALLFEAGFEALVDKVVVVYCKEREQLKRIVLRDDITKDEAMKRIDSQMSQKDKVNMADYVIDNSVSRAELNSSVIKLIKKIREWMM